MGRVEGYVEVPSERRGDATWGVSGGRLWGESFSLRNEKFVEINTLGFVDGCGTGSSLVRTNRPKDTKTPRSGVPVEVSGNPKMSRDWGVRRRDDSEKTRRRLGGTPRQVFVKDTRTL